MRTLGHTEASFLPKAAPAAREQPGNRAPAPASGVKRAAWSRASEQGRRWARLKQRSSLPVRFNLRGNRAPRTRWNKKAGSERKLGGSREEAGRRLGGGWEARPPKDRKAEAREERRAQGRPPGGLLYRLWGKMSSLSLYPFLYGKVKRSDRKRGWEGGRKEQEKKEKEMLDIAPEKWAAASVPTALQGGPLKEKYTWGTIRLSL